MKTILTAALTLVILTMLGCNTPLVPPNQTMGSSTRHARAAMIQNPNAAEERTRSATGLSPTSADIVLENYKRNQKTEVQEKRGRDDGIDVDY